MMWVSFTMDENKQKRKWLVIECKYFIWAKVNGAPQKITLMGSHDKWDDCDIAFMIMMIVKQRRFKCIEWMNKRMTCMMFHLLHEVLEIWPFLTLNYSVCHVQLKNNLVGVKVQGALNAVDYYFIIAFNCNSKLVWGRNVLQKCCGIESIKRGLWVNIMFPALQWDKLHLQALSW
jgi:hypothetical protein